MNRFFVNINNINEDKILIDNEDDIKHISKVLRLNDGDNVEIADNNKFEYICKIKSIDKKAVTLDILDRKEFETEPSVNITLFQGLPKQSKMDYIVQKCTEVGITKIVPIITQRTVVKVSKNKETSKKIDRWRKIALESSKQSKRGIVPKIQEIENFAATIKNINEYDLAILLYENEKNLNIKKLFNNTNSKYKEIALIVGPEGGFSEEEIKLCQDKNIKILTLGKRILRTETAGVVGLAILLHEIESWC